MHPLTPSTLSEEHEDSLVDLAIQTIGHDAPLETFADLLLFLLEDVSGFELMSETRMQALLIHFWSKYCAKKPH